MIAVIADDLTGAAEIGGIGLRKNLRVEITSGLICNEGTDLLVFNTNSRSKNEAQAVITVQQACRKIKECKPELVFKKIDSVLRGHIIAELCTELSELDIPAALIVPANPALERILVNRTYYVGSKPIHETAFRHDPEFPVHHPDVVRMLRAQEEQVTVLKPGHAVPKNGINIGEVHSEQDLTYWAQQTNAQMLAAGSSVFFSAILNLSQPDHQLHDAIKIAAGNTLYVSGTTYHESAQRIKDLQEQGGPVSYLPLPALLQGTANYWFDEVADFIKQYGKAVIAINQEEEITLTAEQLRKYTAEVVQRIFEQVQVNELLIEGGATAAAILEKLNIITLYPVQQLASGTIRSKAGYLKELYITLKPGSYPWGAGSWHF